MAAAAAAAPEDDDDGDDDDEVLPLLATVVSFQFGKNVRFF